MNLRVRLIIYRGIDTSHQDFHGRAKFGVDFVSSPALDPSGHGTHVAGKEITEATSFSVAIATCIETTKILCGQLN